MLLGLLASLMAHAGCDQVLELSVNQAERSFVAANLVALDQALKDARKAVRCLKDPLTSEQSARYHRVEALAAFLKGNEARANELLRATVHADPWLGMEGLFKDDPRLKAQMIAAEEADPSRTADIKWPDDGEVLVNGVAANRAPVEHPWIWQQLDRDGDVAKTAWVDTGASAPGPGGGGSKGGGGAFLASGIASGVVGGALYGLAWSQRARYDQAVEAGDNPAIQSAHTTTNALTIGSVATAGVGLGLVVVGVTR